MKYVISRYNHDLSWLKDYTTDYVLYDRSDEPLEGSIITPNIGTDIYDKFTWIIENYDNLPDVVCLIKANLFKYISKEEFDKVKDSKSFTPLLTQGHKTYSDGSGEVCFYKDGIYWERNDSWYLMEHRTKNLATTDQLRDLLRIRDLKYIPFAPGSNYILTKENIKQHSKEDYILLRSFLDWAVYPGEAQLIERGLYLLWQQ